MAFSAKYVLALVAVFFSQGICASHIRRSTDSTTTVDDLINNARTHLQSATEEWNKLVGTSNLDELKTVLETKTQELQTRTKNVLDELTRQYQTHGSELSERLSSAVAEATNHINATLENLKSQAPGALNEAEALQKRFADAFKSTAEVLFQETGKIARAAGDDVGSAHDDLTAITRNALSQTTEVVQQLQSGVEDFIKRNTA